VGGANVADTLDQVVEYGAWWMPTALDVGQIDADLADLRRRCELAGRDPAELTLGCYAPLPEVGVLEALAERGFTWAALQVRPALVRDERETLDRFRPLLDHFGQGQPAPRPAAGLPSPPG
jgi:alkanesulfonate monooxygenase SsuD/methylene tetrahydromethanopterin reductase-like flavin-dependent oxidoreductase (luciferase family)